MVGRLWGVTTLACLLLLTPAVAAEVPDLTQVNRKIINEPDYTCDEPLYGLYVFGPAGKTQVWSVLDKSSADKAQYDVLYFDRNANGDLTEEGERLVAEEGKATFKISDFTDPATGDVHTDLSISRRSDGSVFLRMLHKGEHMVMGGYAEQAGPYCQFATSAEEAPVLWPGADGMFSFQRWIWQELPIGSEGDVRVFLGHQRPWKSYVLCGTAGLPTARDASPGHTDLHGYSRARNSQVLSKLRERC